MVEKITEGRGRIDPEGSLKIPLRNPIDRYPEAYLAVIASYRTPQDLLKYLRDLRINHDFDRTP